MRCVKACPPNDMSCALDLVHLISHTALSLPTFRDFKEPEEIVFLRTMTPAKSGDTHVYFNILAADDHFSFDVVRRSYNDMVMGVVRQVKPITGPKTVVVEVAMNYIKSGVISHRNLIVIHLFISEFWF